MSSTPQLPTITEHLRWYGIQTFSSQSYWPWAEQRLGRSKMRKVDRLHAEAWQGESPNLQALRRYYDFIADPLLLGTLVSKQADDIAQGLRVITEATAGRERILDLGCSAGYMSTWLARQNKGARHVTGVDHSERTIKEAHRQAELLGLDNVTFVHANLEDTFPSGPFDAVVDSAVLQYISRLPTVLDKIREELLPDGILISVPQLGRARDAAPFLDMLRSAGFGTQSFSFVHATDLGRPIARPVIICGIGGEKITVDLEERYEKVRSTLQTTRIVPLCESEGVAAL